jgi:hypothetical protein
MHVATNKRVGINDGPNLRPAHSLIPICFSRGDIKRSLGAPKSKTWAFVLRVRCPNNRGGETQQRNFTQTGIGNRPRCPLSPRGRWRSRSGPPLLSANCRRRKAILRWQDGDSIGCTRQFASEPPPVYGGGHQVVRKEPGIYGILLLSRALLRLGRELLLLPH